MYTPPPRASSVLGNGSIEGVVHRALVSTDCHPRMQGGGVLVPPYALNVKMQSSKNVKGEAPTGETWHE